MDTRWVCIAALTICSSGLAEPYKGLTLRDEFLRRVLASDLSTLPYVSILGRFAVSEHTDVVVLIADSCRLSNDPYSPVAWWTPKGTLHVLLQDDRNPQSPKPLAKFGQRWDGCLARVEPVEAGFIVFCSAGNNESVKRLRIIIDKAGQSASVVP
jgi:hypothetical protein